MCGLTGIKKNKPVRPRRNLLIQAKRFDWIVGQIGSKGGRRVAGENRPLVVLHMAVRCPCSGANDRLAILEGLPCKSNAGRKVVIVSVGQFFSLPAEELACRYIKISRQISNVVRYPVNFIA